MNPPALDLVEALTPSVERLYFVEDHGGEQQLGLFLPVHSR